MKNPLDEPVDTDEPEVSDASMTRRTSWNIRKLLKTVDAYPKLKLASIVIAALAILIAVVTLLAPSEADMQELHTTEPISVASPAFLQMLAGLTNTEIIQGPKPVILNNGSEFIPAMIDQINQAESSVNFTTYIWSDGVMSDQIYDALIAAAKRGVEVRVLVDGFAGSPPKDRTQELEDAGGRVEEYKPIGLSKILEYHKRTHRRAIVIDGKTAYVGGAAVDDVWLGNGKSEKEWREVMIEVHGPVARSVQNAFADIWTETTGEVLVGERFYPELQQAAVDATFIHFISSPSESSQTVRATLLLSILGSQEKLYITNPYFLPDEQTLLALQDRARAGVDVRILVPKGNIWQPVLTAQQIHYDDLIKAGVKLYEYNEYVHSKTLTADGAWSLVGSANIDSRSRVLNDENVLGIADPEFAAELEAVFMRDLEFSQELTIEKWNKRSIFKKALAYASYLFAKQY